jgi:hypothetical protein
MGKGAVKALDELRKAQKNLCDLQYYLYLAVAAEIHLQLGTSGKQDRIMLRRCVLPETRRRKHFWRRGSESWMNSEDSK